ncbi:twin-arginine translocase subunit TatC [Halobellus rubicundus]|uniref:Sec-independent protein translocase protein TatC n=1 Tax=Halobellus rubicundus TaxID=2996466 RepID=A0ABD5ME05_9EURY
MADDGEDPDRTPDGDEAGGDHADSDASGVSPGDDADDADSAPDRDPDATPDPDSDSEPDRESSPESDADADTDPDGNTDTDADGNANTESGSESGSDSDVDPPTETPDIHPRAEDVAAAAGSSSSEDPASDADTESDADADSDTDADPDSGGDADSDTDADSETADDPEAPSVADVAADAADDDAADDDAKKTADDEEDSDSDSDSDSDPDFDADTATDSEIGPSSEEIVAGTDGGASVNAGETGVADPAPVVDEGFEPEGPESDEEMPLADHIEEMIRRLAVVLGVGGIVTLLLYPGADLVNSAFGLDLVSSTEVIDFLWNKHIPGAPEMVDRRPRVYGPLELLLTELKVAALGGLVVALPVFVYETYLFMRPGLYPKERRYYLAAVPTSVVLAFIGISFAHFIVLPAIFAYFTSYTTGTALVAFGLKETFNLILILMGYNAIIFQIPLFVMLAIMMNLVTRTWLEERRLLFWGTFLGLAFLVSPDPTGMAPIIIALTMIGLFEGTLLALRWTGSGN